MVVFIVSKVLKAQRGLRLPGELGHFQSFKYHYYAG